MNPDFLIIGGGIIGFTIARELKTRFPHSTISLIEKEPQPGAHSSGRNSGVLHAGFYYTPNSLKAKMTCEGNRLLRDYCQSRKIKIKNCGKIVVAKNESELEGLELLFDRGRKNGVTLHELSESEARKIEPRIKTWRKAIFSPTTSVVDPEEALGSLAKEVEESGVQVSYGDKFIKATNGKITSTKSGNFEAGYIINAAGLYADKIAREFGFSSTYRILPFKGIYLYSNEPPGSLHTLIYPVPDMKYPFLGVHFTITVHDRVKIGPTAIPAFWREQYDGWQNFSAGELLEIVSRQIGLMVKSEFDFKKLAVEEIKKYSKKYLVSKAAELATGVNHDQYQTWGRPGIRAQLFDIKQKKLEMDFVIEGDEKSAHILNAVSPAFTCSIPFARYVCDKIQSFRNLPN